MNTKKLVMAGAAGFVVMFLISGLWYMVLMKGYYDTQFAAVNRAEPMMLWIVLGYLAAAFLMAYIYPLGYKGGPPAKEGMRFGLLIGLAMALPLGLVLYGVNNTQLSATLVDIVYQVVEKTVGGAIIGLVFGSGGSSE